VGAGTGAVIPLWDPSVKTLQQDYGVGRDTVLHALQLLRDDGLIFTVSKRGSYVSQPR
jgi:DNA-binding GntR family transcriptional regulator